MSTPRDKRRGRRDNILYAIKRGAQTCLPAWLPISHPAFSELLVRSGISGRGAAVVTRSRKTRRREKRFVFVGRTHGRRIKEGGMGVSSTITFLDSELREECTSLLRIFIYFFLIFCRAIHR